MVRGLVAIEVVILYWAGGGDKSHTPRLAGIRALNRPSEESSTVMIVVLQVAPNKSESDNETKGDN